MQLKVVKQGSQSPRETKVEMYGFYIQWSKIVQHVNTSNEANQRHKYLQNYGENLDMGKHSFLLVITI